MQFPEKPTCHDKNLHAQRFGPQIWRPARTGPNQSHPDNDGPFRPYRTCSYCGSIHPEDLLKALENGAKLESADWKYGWPHKFYVENISHDYENVEVVVGSRYENGVRAVTDRRPMGKGHAKWYNTHFLDEGMSQEVFDKLANHILRQTGVVFFREEGTGEVMFRCFPR